MRVFVLSATCLTIAATSAFAQATVGGRGIVHDSLWVGSVNFRVGNSLVLADYMNNAATLASLRRLMNTPGTIETIDRIVITAGASPEGNLLSNSELANNRALEVRGYMRWQWSRLQDIEFELHSLGEDWSGLRAAVAGDPMVPHRREVLDLLDGLGDDSTLRGQLRHIGGGTAYSYLSQAIFPHLRESTIVIIDTKEDLSTAPAESGHSETPTATVPDAEHRPTHGHSTGTDRQHTAEDDLYEGYDTTTPIVDTASAEFVRKPLLAFKTNLLFDVATIINVEAEVPIGTRFSVAGEWIFPWWLLEDKQYAAELGAATLEGRRWFGDRSQHPLMTGWFAGVHAGGGYYDMEWKKNGHQGEFFVAGFSGGYAHTVSRNGNWRMEYSLGLGYMGARYREYAPTMGSDGEWRLIKQTNGNYHWIGPTRAKVSLVWMLDRRVQVKGGAR